MKKLLAVFLLLSVPAIAQENMTFGKQSQTQSYQIKAPGKAVVVVNNPQTCNPPSNLVGKNINEINGMRFNQPVRIIHPGEMITSDFNQLRIDMMLDENNIIRNVHCG